jgi:hypothetical protein
MATTLTAIRGDTFTWSFTLSVDPATYTGGLRFTARKEDPDSSVTTDDDAPIKASTADGTITTSGTTVTISVPAATTTAWPVGTFISDVQGVITGPPVVVHTFPDEDGKRRRPLTVEADITRST